MSFDAARKISTVENERCGGGQVEFRGVEVDRDVLGPQARPDGGLSWSGAEAWQTMAFWDGRRTGLLTANHLADRNRMCRRFVNPTAQALFVNRAEAALPPTFNETVATIWLVAATGSFPCTLFALAGLRSTL